MAHLQGKTRSNPPSLSNLCRRMLISLGPGTTSVMSGGRQTSCTTRSHDASGCVNSSCFRRPSQSHFWALLLRLSTGLSGNDRSIVCPCCQELVFLRSGMTKANCGEIETRCWTRLTTQLRTHLAFDAHQRSSPAVYATQKDFWTLSLGFATRFAGDLYIVVLVNVQDQGGKQQRRREFNSKRSSCSDS